MKKFRFKLQTVLRFAEQEEERLKLELAWLRVQKQEMEQQLNVLYEARVTAKETLISQSQGLLDIEKVTSLHRHIETLDDQIQEKQVEIEQQDVVIAKKMDEVIEAMKKRQMLEKLREREKHEYNLAFNRMEIRLIDDTTAPRYTVAAAKKA